MPELEEQQDTEQPFTDWISEFLTKKQMRLGRQLVDDNQCVITYSDRSTILAIVRGFDQEVHELAVNFQRRYGELELGMGCDCRVFQRRSLCEHVAALALMADNLGVSQPLPFTELFDGDAMDVHAIRTTFKRHNINLEAFIKQLAASNGSAPHVRAAPPAWKKQLRLLKRSMEMTSGEVLYRNSSKKAAKPRQYYFALGLEESKRSKKLVLTPFFREQLKSGQWGALREVRNSRDEILENCSPGERQIFETVFGADEAGPYSYSSYQRVETFSLSSALSEIVVPKLCATGQLLIKPKHDPDAELVTPLLWDAGPTWRFDLTWKRSSKAEAWNVDGRIVRQLPDESIENFPLKGIRLLLPGGLWLRDETLGLMDLLSPEQETVLEHLRKHGPFSVPEKEIDQFVVGLSTLPHGAAIPLPKELKWETHSPEGIPRVQIKPPRKPALAREGLLGANVSFDYGGQQFGYCDPRTSTVDAANRRILERNRQREQERFKELLAQGFVHATYYLVDDFELQIPGKKLAAAVTQLAALGWHVEAEGAVIRRPGKINISISSGLDWFDLTADCDFDGVKASLPALLAAVAQGQKYVELGDGSKGMLPEEWLAKYAPLAEMGETQGDALRFLPTQAIILDALLAAQPDATHDTKFAEARDRLRNFGGIKASREPETFQGALRAYQRDGLGWLEFLQEFGFGGCLADDMGLGKTVQVLALLEGRRKAALEAAATNGNARRKNKVESLRTLVVAPKSLVFNWLDEAKRFAPQLKTFDYTGVGRKESPEAFAAADLIVTTYGTLRQDILTLREMDFHQVILDEAQAIKNSASQSAKACRLVQARHRLAMTGTPVENRLGDLWSIFEFLNPGMLGRSSNIRLFSGRTLPDKESLGLLSRALRPFLLRRTKAQVLEELPAKTEQTLFCEMDDQQRKLYNELRDHYRALLTQKIKDTGLAKSKIQVLEALLRLRQAACHPGLLDKKKADDPSAKFDALLAQLEEVVAEKHKVLVFSQFTSLLALVKKQLDLKNITYEYLDGKTSNRKQRVDRFQNDPECPVFLISLKAGGHGLNLTAADYVYILDPWWNPAVEAQAVDRAHRLGQDKPVFVYRLIASGTVEEKILELQDQKRDLADAIISADGSLLKNLSADDLQLLLS